MTPEELRKHLFENGFVFDLDWPKIEATIRTAIFEQTKRMRRAMDKMADKLNDAARKAVLEERHVCINVCKDCQDSKLTPWHCMARIEGRPQP